MGDPQQLPATLFSQRAKEVQMERSLFERLQQVGGVVGRKRGGEEGRRGQTGANPRWGFNRRGEGAGKRQGRGREEEACVEWTLVR